MKKILLSIFLIPIFSFAQTFEEKDLTILNQKEGFELAGTLTIPTNKPDFKIGIMITGSGQTDRDETIGKHKIFKDIATKLAANGIATYRYDDRGGYKSKGPKVQNSTAEQLASDAVEAFTHIAKLYPGHKIGFIGHSEGGGLAALAAMILMASAEVNTASSAIMGIGLSALILTWSGKFSAWMGSSQCSIWRSAIPSSALRASR